MLCRDKYRVLERFEVQVPDAQLDLLDKLDAEWAKFQVRPMPSGRLLCRVCKTGMDLGSPHATSGS